MAKKLAFIWRDGAACLAGLLSLHMFLAGFGPCPYRDSMFVTVEHAGHQHHQVQSQTRAVAVPLNGAPCPYELMHAMYGVFRAAPPAQSRPTLVAPITVKLSVEPLQAHWTLSRSIDPPPRAS